MDDADSMAVRLSVFVTPRSRSPGLGFIFVRLRVFGFSSVRVFVVWFRFSPVKLSAFAVSVSVFVTPRSRAAGLRYSSEF